MKNRIRAILSLVLLLLVFTLCYFLLPLNHNNQTVHALNYVFCVLAFLVNAYVIYLIFFKEEKVKSKVYGLPIGKVAISYLILTLLYGIAILILNNFYEVKTIFGYLVHIAFFAFSVIGVFITTGAKEEVKRQDNEIKINTMFMDNFKNDIKVFSKAFDYEPLKKKFNDLFELVIYSDPVSSDKLVEIEDEIDKAYLVLKDNYYKKDYYNLEISIDLVSKLINERNLICKVNK